MWLALWTLSISAGAEECLDRDAALAQAEEAVVQARLELVESLLADLEKSWSCGEVATPAHLGRAWLIEGALHTYRDEPERAEEAFVAAARVAPDLWLPDLGDPMRKTAETAAATAAKGSEEDHGTIDVEPLPEGAMAAVDGQIGPSPFGDPDLCQAQPSQSQGEYCRVTFEVRPGLHLVQVGFSETDIRQSWLVVVGARSHVVATILHGDPILGGATEPDDAPEAPTAQAVRDPVAEATRPESVTALHLGAGPTATAGMAPLMLGLEMGVIVRTAGVWGRAAAGLAPVLVGDLVFQGAYDDRSWPVAVDGQIAGGAVVGASVLGVSAGVSLPSRLTTRALASLPIADGPLRLEIRGGLNLVAGGETEPAAALRVTWSSAQ